MHQEQTIRPYLGLRAQLSLSWLSQLLLTIILLCVALAGLLSTLDTSVQDAKSSYVASCASVESAANVMVSLPHYAADNVNRLNAKAVSTVVDGSAWVVDSSLLAIKTVIVFLIDTYRSLLFCLLEFALHGTLDVLIAAIQSAQDALNGALTELTRTIESAVSGVNSAINAVADTVDKIPGVDIGDVDISADLSKIQSITIGSDAIAGIQKLNESIPTFEEIKAALEGLVARPIDDLRSQVATRLANATIDIEQLPVPAKASVALCADLDTTFIEDVGRTIAKFAKVALILLSVFALLVVCVQAFLARHRHRRMMETLEERRAIWLLDTKSPERYLSNSNLLSFLNAMDYPRLTALIERLATLLGLGQRGRNSLHWAASYIFHRAATLFLLLGVAGLVLTEVQLAVVEGPVKRVVSTQTAEGVSRTADSAFDMVQSSLAGSSGQYAADTNRVINALAVSVNEDLFGWVNVTTATMNNSMNAFYDNIATTLNGTFAATPLGPSINELLYCVVGSKVDGISKALTWIHDNARIAFPVIANDTLLPSAERTRELTSSLNDPESSVPTASIVERLVDRYAQALRAQRLTYIICLVIWLVVVFAALFGLLWMHCLGQRVSRVRKRRSSCPSFGEKGEMKAFRLGSTARLRGDDALDKDDDEIVLPLGTSSDPLRPPPAARFDWLRWTPTSTPTSMLSHSRERNAPSGGRTAQMRERAGAWAQSVTFSLRDRSRDRDQTDARRSDGWVQLDDRQPVPSAPVKPFATPFDHPLDGRAQAF